MKHLRYLRLGMIEHNKRFRYLFFTRAQAKAYNIGRVIGSLLRI